jgi:methylmalonyl-CoA epimerase
LDDQKNRPQEDKVFKKLNHIGIGVKNVEQAAKLWTEVFGVKAKPPMIEGEMKVVMIPLGDILVELIAPVGDQGVIARFLEKRGEGIHHLCFEVEDIYSAMKELAAKGMELVDKEPREGAEGKIAFLHPKSTYGVLTEIVQVR